MLEHVRLKSNTGAKLAPSAIRAARSISARSRQEDGLVVGASPLC